MRMRLLVAGLLAMTPCVRAGAATEAVFVEKGSARSVREIGNAWTEKRGTIECGGTGNFLVAGKAVGAGDFRIHARLSLEQLDGTAASLVIGGNHFGFDGQGEKLFVEGPALGQTRLLADSQEFITPGKPFDVEVVRRGETLSFRVDGNEVLTGKYELPPVCAIGLRPWRGTMRLHDFAASGNLTPVTDLAISAMRHDFKTVGAVTVGRVEINLASPPEGLALCPDLGILAADAVQGKIIHRSGRIVWVPRATMTPKGDYLTLFPEGKGRYYQGEKMLAYRSFDKGKTWVGPTVAFDSSQSHHGFVPLIPHDSKRIYAFGTQPIPGMVGARSKGLHENAPIGFRYSDDDGHTWSDVTLIRPENDPDFTGMSCVRMCETDKGTWLIGSHDGIWHRKGSPAPVTTRQYILRSEDEGKTWTLLPKKRPGGWYLEKYDRMDEGTVVSLGGEKAAIFIRTAEGHIWESRTDDDGKTWSEAKPTTMVHPDAPPMIFHLGDGKTLISFIHNRYDPRKAHFDKAARNELWCSISKDQGRTWSEPRFVFAGATSGGHIHSCSYIDMFADGSRIHIFLGQYGRQLLYLNFDESDIVGFPTEGDLARAQQTANAQARARPSFLIIHVDDLGWADPGCFGNEFIETPNIDRLAAEGMRFTQAYAASPVCASSRAGLVSGQYPARCGVHDVTPQFTRPWEKVIQPTTSNALPKGCVTIAQALKPGGYVSASVGKHGRIGSPADHGFVSGKSAAAEYFPEEFRAELDRWTRANDQKAVGTQTRQAIRFMGAHRDKPFFCYLNYHAVHEPARARKDLIEKYKAKAAGRKTKIHPAYAAMTETVDESVGIIVEALDKLGLADKTVVIFFSDNGGMVKTDSERPTMTDNSPLRDGKGTLYEGGIRVPMIVRYPPVVKPDTTCGVPVFGCDFYPTMVELAGLRPPDRHILDGVSLVPLLKQTGTIKRDTLYFHYPNFHMTTPVSAIREGDFKLIEYFGYDRLELYDLKTDPGEKNDLARTMPENATALRGRLEQWREEVGAATPNRNPDYDPKKARTWGPRGGWNNVP